MRSEKRVLDVIGASETRSSVAFGQMKNLERWLFGGDLRFFQHVADLANGEMPLLICEPGAKFQVPYWDKIDRETFLAQRLNLSVIGEAVLQELRAHSIYCTGICTLAAFISGPVRQCGPGMRRMRRLNCGINFPLPSVFYGHLLADFCGCALATPSVSVLAYLLEQQGWR